MARTTFRGPVSVGDRDVAFGTLIASRNLLLTPTANATTALTFKVPPGGPIRATVFTTTAFTGTTVTVKIGTTPGGAELCAATSIKAAGTVALALTPAAVADTGNKTLYATIDQTGPTAVGSARLVLEYVPFIEGTAGP